MWTFVSREAETSPFVMCQEAPGKRWSTALSVSSAVHVLVLLILCLPKTPTFVKPNLLAKGDGGRSAPEAIALYLPQDIQSETQHSQAVVLPRAHQQRAHKAKAKVRHNVLEEEKSDSNEIGSNLGSAVDGPAYGDEVKPALPDAFSDPHISRGEVPAGLQGDVVVEITIDAQGNVTETKLLQGLGHGIDERVIAAARAWHFHPATRNGMAILSKQDYRFHFPS